MKHLSAFGLVLLCLSAVFPPLPASAADGEDAEETVVSAAPWIQKFRVRAKEVPLELLRLSPGDQRSKGMIVFTAEFKRFHPKLGPLEDEFRSSKYLLLEVVNEGELLPIVVPKNNRRVPYEELVSALKRKDWVLVVGKVQSVKLKKESSNSKVYVLMVEALYRIPGDEIGQTGEDPEDPEAKPEVKPEVKPAPKPEVKPAPKPEVKPEAKPAPKPEVKPALDDEWI